MNEEVVDDVTRLEVVEGVQYQSKEDEYSLRPESCPLFKPQEILAPTEHEYSQISPLKYDDIGRDNNVSETISEHQHLEQFFAGDGFMVEELTVKSYDGSSLDIGTSSRREGFISRQSQWGHLYQLTGDSGAGNSGSQNAYRDNVLATSNMWEDVGSSSFPRLLAKESLSDDQSKVMENFTTTENKGGAGDVHRGIRTKMISKSGFSEYFIKHTLKGKGIICKGPSSDCFRVDSKDPKQMKVGIDTSQMDSNGPLSSASKTEKSSYTIAVPRSDVFGCNGMTLREWLKARHQNVNKAERLHIFRNIVDLVERVHSQGVALLNLQPSYFKILPSYQVTYLGSPIHQQISETVVNSEILTSDDSLVRKRVSGQLYSPSPDMWSKKKKYNENVTVAGHWSLFSERSDFYHRTISDGKVNSVGPQRMSSIPCMYKVGQLPLTPQSERLENAWYTSPEGGCTRSSNIYCLGVLLFEVC